jgi:uncharacterized damage-inducible protein DinB
MPTCEEEPMQVADLLTLYDYNDWANERMLRTSASLTTEQFTARTRFPHGSLRATLVHTLNAESIWLDFWQGTLPEVWPPFLREEAFPDLATLCGRWRQKEAERRAYFATVSDSDLGQPRTFVSPNGRINHTGPLWNFMIHPVTHGTQHRSEVAQMLTEFGHSPGDFDLMFFLTGEDA